MEVLGKCFGHQSFVDHLEMNQSLPLLVSSSSSESCVWRVIAPKVSLSLFFFFFFFLFFILFLFLTFYQMGNSSRVSFVAVVENFSVVTWVPGGSLFGLFSFFSALF